MIAENHSLEPLAGHRAGAGWMVRCPAHEDRKPNLSISSGRDGKVLVRCHAGCGRRNPHHRRAARPDGLGSETEQEVGGGGASAQFAFPMNPTPDPEAREAGHKPQSPLQAIREKCLDCSCYQLNEIRPCEAVNCPLWPFRAGKHPWRAEARKTPLTDANSDRQTHLGDEGLPSC